MRNKPHYFELNDVVNQFVAAFDDVYIKRYNKDREPEDEIKVTYVYAPKQRVVHDIINEARHITLPVIAVHITDISRDEDRVFNKIDGAYYQQGRLDDTSPLTLVKSDHILQPVPVSIQMQMSILTNKQHDMDQIISNFIPYCDPYLTISWKTPGVFVEIEQEIRTTVHWNGRVGLNYPVNINGSDPYRISADTGFTLKSWIFKQHKPEDEPKNIYTVNVNVSALESSDTAISTISKQLISDY